MSTQPQRKAGISVWEFLGSWGKILTGSPPMLSIEITRECPLHCPGCYAYTEGHLGGGVTLRQLADLRGDALVEGILQLVRKHRPIHVSLVGGEPMVRRRELDRILPALAEIGVHILLVTSGIVPLPKEWMSVPRLRVCLSVDGLPEHHNVRRKPATYDRILANIAGCTVNVHCVVTRPMLQRTGYLEEYVRFWSARPEVNRIWVSIYSPQVGEDSPEMLSPDDRRSVGRQLRLLCPAYPKLLMPEGMARAFVQPPQSPAQCMFSRMSTNYSADLKTRVEPCVLGGTPDCSQCGCVASMGLHFVGGIKLAGLVRIEDLVRGSVAIGSALNARRATGQPSRWGIPSRKRPSQQQLPEGDSLLP